MQIWTSKYSKISYLWNDLGWKIIPQKSVFKKILLIFLNNFVEKNPANILLFTKIQKKHRHIEIIVTFIKVVIVLILLILTSLF